MNILFTICGRAGSKGLKNKNLKIFNGYPLVAYTISSMDLFIKENEEHDIDIALNTDSSGLINIVKDFNLNVNIINRKDFLSGDFVSKVDVIRDTYIEMKKINNREYNIVIDLDITSPLRTKNDLNNLVNKKNGSDADVIFSVTDSRRSPYFNMVSKIDGNYKRILNTSFVTRQEAPKTYDMNASMYAYSPQFLMSAMSLFEGKCDIIKMCDTAILDIDNEEDFELMQVMAEYLINKRPDFNEIYTNIKNIINF